ncbi:ROK family protein [Cardiobacteriaceae bacterium TAE3-ERU3]|nr:ROK family protein [Cardiobacteriaceae bacterium TAE3-ERU3]
MNILTIDIGGTEIKSAIYREDGEPVQAFPNQPTAVTRDGNRIGEQIVAWVKDVQKTHDIDGVAIASAGVIDHERGEVVFAGDTIPGYSGTALSALISEQCGVPCSAENDVNAVALGESWLGAAKGSSSALCITVGTGIGGAIVIDGQLIHGHNFAAGEIGYLPAADGKTFEQSASTSALLADYQARTGERIDGKTLFARAAAGDSHAEAALTRQIDVLAQGLLAANYLLAPQTIVIGGGIAAQRDILEPRIRAAFEQQIKSPRLMPQHIRCAALGNKAGMLGALRHYCQIHS